MSWIQFALATIISAFLAGTQNVAGKCQQRWCHCQQSSSWRLVVESWELEQMLGFSVWPSWLHWRSVESSYRVCLLLQIDLPQPRTKKEGCEKHPREIMLGMGLVAMAVFTQSGTTMTILSRYWGRIGQDLAGKRFLCVVFDNFAILLPVISGKAGGRKLQKRVPIGGHCL